MHEIFVHFLLRFAGKISVVFILKVLVGQ